MSQSQRKRKSKALSQPQSTNLEETEEMQNLSLEELTKKCVRFLLTKMHSNIAIKRAEIINYVFHEKPGKNYDIVLQNAIQILKRIYGLDIEVIDSDTSTKKYFVSNCLPYAHLIPRDTENDIKSVITFLVLTHIFMTKNNSTDTELWQFLKEFDLKPETDLEDLGNIKLFVTQTLVKQNYILFEDRGRENENEEPKKCYKWGTRADETVSKIDILKFISKLYGTNVKFWSEQYKDACQQFAGN